MDKILFVGADRKYFHVKKNEEKNSLEPTKDYVLATDVLPYGFQFTFGEDYGEHNIYFWSPAYIHYENSNLSKEEVGKKNLETLIKKLEKMRKNSKADFILIDEFSSRDDSVSWQISGIVQLLIKR